MNILEYVNGKLGGAIRHSEDPTPAIAASEEHTLMGAAIPAALAGLYLHGGSIQEVGAVTQLVKTQSDLSAITDTRILEILFDDKQDAVARSVAAYAGSSVEDASRALSRAGREGIRALQEHFKGKEVTEKEISVYLLSQRSHILPYLPAHIQLGRLLEREEIDDVVHKMTGPVSGAMQKIGDMFTRPKS